MPSYILLLTLTQEGRELALDDSNFIQKAAESCGGHGVQVLGMYGVLGDCDYVNLIMAPDNEAAARFSLELGVKARVHAVTMPAIPISRFGDSERQAEVAEPHMTRADRPQRANGDQEQKPAEQRQGRQRS